MAERQLTEPPPYREPETVVREWIEYYRSLFPGQAPSTRWLSEKTRLGKSCVSNHRMDVLSTKRIRRIKKP
jgi:hypothetical protein